MASTPHRAEPPRIPVPSQAQMQAVATEQKRRKGVESSERRGMVRSLLILALVVLIVSIARAGLDRVFPQGWWRP